MRVKNRLKSYRHKYEMNQTEFAAFLGISSDQYHSRIIESEPWQPKGRTVFPAVLMITEKRYPIESKAVRFVQVAELGELFEKETKTPTKLQKIKGVQIKLA